MRKPGDIVRHPFRRIVFTVGVILALFALTSPGFGQVANVWSAIGPSVPISSLAIDPGNPNIIYAGTQSGLLKSTDGGASWKTIFSGYVTAMVIDFSNPNVIYAGTRLVANSLLEDRYLYKSIDGGANWSNSGSPIDFDIGLLVMDPTSSQTLYAGSEWEDFYYGGITPWKSTDGGATWEGKDTFNLGLASYGWSVNPINPQILYAPGTLYHYPSPEIFGLFKSTDGGDNWSATGLTDTYSVCTAIDPANPNILYVATSQPQGKPFRGMLKSTDGGASWFAINNGMSDLLSTSTPILAIAIDQSNPNLVYAGSAGKGVFKSSDGGASWSSLNNGLTNLNVRSLLLASGNSHVLYARTSGDVFKIVDSSVPTTNPIDDVQVFVRQHYRDFLNREPDASGLDFWTNNILSCGLDQQCVEVKRIDTSAAYFLSIEFQQTGYLVYRMYKAAYGNLPNAPVPLRFDEFLPDTKEIGQGVVVNQTGWQQVLENNKQGFAAEFTQRQRFNTAFPVSMPAQVFVNTLNANAGNPLSSSEREQLTNDLLLGTTTRAQALRAVAENSQLAQQEFNRAFVLMQYFGYLRRNPNDAPEPMLDFQGYNFWLNKLNTFNGNFEQAEMVKAFLQSIEYRQRFGP